MAIPHPTAINYVEADELLTIDFADGVSITYPARLLRGFCPCARCQGHGAGPAKWKPPYTTRGYVVENVSPVGSYAICILWGDGHDTGIYSYATLRNIDVSNFDFDAMTSESELPLRE